MIRQRSPGAHHFTFLPRPPKGAREESETPRYPKIDKLAVLSRFLAFVLFAATAFLPSLAAAEAAADPGRLIGTGFGRAPRPGEWLDYVACFQSDPLEHSLAPHDPNAGATEAGDTRNTLPEPEFDTPVTWTCEPLRLEIHQIVEGGVRASLTYTGLTKNVFLPLPRQEKESGDGGVETPSGETTRQQVGEREVEVEVGRGGEGATWYLRYVNRDIPFGLVRFACENLDLILVNYGEGLPPAMPSRPPPVNPPAGGLAPKRQ